jgi:alanyl-tRNA synthetase
MRTFSSHIVDRCEVEGQPAVELEATAFYPTAGGQPHDMGTLNEAAVVAVQVDEEGRILHILDRPLAQVEVEGAVDWPRRLDHMQQHTGQHILSQAFRRVCKAETVGFHLGESQSTIDLVGPRMAGPGASLANEQVEKAEQAANEVVMSALPVTARFVDDDELTTLPLRARGPPRVAVEEQIRIVEVQGYDWSACGGTHVQNSGQVGPIKVVRTERRNEKTRVHFVCGGRALADYASKHKTVQALASHLTTSESELLPSVERMEAEIKEARKAHRAAQSQLLSYQVEDWIAKAETVGATRIVQLAFDQRDSNLLKETARRLTEQPGVVALLATRQPRPQYVFARSEDWGANMGAPNTGAPNMEAPNMEAPNMGELMRASCAVTGGRGGGRPQFAQGGAPQDTPVEPVLDHARQQLTSH